jgi:NTP pyrophosphatase (non-canonical NTP hydrolase)
MNLDEYQNLSRRTHGHFSSPEAQAQCVAMGLFGEAGEAVDYLKKVLFHGKAMDQAKFALELGDILFYLAWKCDLDGLSLGDVSRSSGGWMMSDETATMALVHALASNATSAVYESVKPPARSPYTVATILDALRLLASRFCGYTIEEVAMMNVGKLAARYPDGFSAEASEKRVDTVSEAVKP